MLRLSVTLRSRTNADPIHLEDRGRDIDLRFREECRQRHCIRLLRLPKEKEKIAQRIGIEEKNV